MASPSPAIVQVQVTDDNLSRIQQNIITGVNGLQQQLVNTPSGGQFLNSITLKTGNNNVPHTLGKVPSGYIVTDNTAASTIYRVSYSNALVVLHASAPTTVNLFIF